MVPVSVSSLFGAARSRAAAAGAALVSVPDTIMTIRRVALQVEALVGELEDPLRQLAPGLTRLARLLEDPVLDDLPDVLRQAQSELIPLLRTLHDTQSRLTALPGASLLGALAGWRPTTTAGGPAASPERPGEQTPPRPVP